MTTRNASHAGSWYSDSASVLSAELDSWLAKVSRHVRGVGEIPKSGARVIIAP